MAAQKKSSRNGSSFFTKDLFIFISIMAIVAIMTYFLTYNAITARFTQQVGETAAPEELLDITK